MQDIIISHINKSYGGIEVFKDFSAVLKGGCIYRLTSPSGSGKTTLMRMLMGLEAPDSGSINGIPESVSAVFQEDRLVEQLSVLDNIMLVLKSTEAAHAAAMSALSQLGLEAFAGTRASELSGGMQRRTALIRAVLCPSELLLLDEPFTGLDTGLVELSAEYILQKAHNRTVLIAGHIENELIKSNSTELSILRER